MVQNIKGDLKLRSIYRITGKETRQFLFNTTKAQLVVGFLGNGVSISMEEKQIFPDLTEI